VTAVKNAIIRQWIRSAISKWSWRRN